MRYRILFLAVFAVILQLPAWAYNPKIKAGINDLNGTGTDECREGSDVRLPIGLPFQYTDISSGSGSSESGNKTSDQPARIVYSFDLTEEIGPASLRQTHTALEEARSMNAACVLIRINSYSGAIDAAENIRKELQDYNRPIIIYVDGKAISAAALISMAGDSVYMSKGSGIEGTVHASGKENKNSAVSEKNKSALTAAQMKNSSNNSNQTDQSCIMSSSEAVRSHLVNAETSNMNEVLARAGVTDCELVYYTPGFVEKMIDWCMKPIVSLSILAFLVFAIRIQQRSVFPGPVTFLLLAALPLFCLPLYQGALSNGFEILFLILAVISALIPSIYRSSKWIVKLIPALLLIVAFTLCQTGTIRNTGLTEIGFHLLFTSLAFFTGWIAFPFLGKMAIKIRTDFRIGKTEELASAS